MQGKSIVQLKKDPECKCRQDTLKNLASNNTFNCHEEYLGILVTFGPNKYQKYAFLKKEYGFISEEQHLSEKCPKIKR